jgi:hypothetical protein
MQAVPPPGSSLHTRWAFHPVIPEQERLGDTCLQRPLPVFLSRPLCCFEATVGGQGEGGGQAEGGLTSHHESRRTGGPQTCEPEAWD